MSKTGRVKTLRELQSYHCQEPDQLEEKWVPQADYYRLQKNILDAARILREHEPNWLDQMAACLLIGSRPDFKIVTAGKRSNYYERDPHGRWILKKSWVDNKK